MSYYRYIYRENFDQCGKKGSMRHFLTTGWGHLVGLMGLWQAIVWSTVCGVTLLSPAVYTIFQSVKSTVEMYQKRVKEVAEWLADEKVELLKDTIFLEDFGEGKEMAGKEETGEKTSVEESLASPPSDIPLNINLELDLTEIHKRRLAKC